MEPLLRLTIPRTKLKWLLVGLLLISTSILVSGCLETASLYEDGPTAPHNEENIENYSEEHTEISEDDAVTDPDFSVTELNYTSREDRIVQEGNTVAGVFVSDYDNDDYPDVLALGGDEPVLFENEGGERLQATEAIPDLDVNFTSALFFDHDNDGWEDLYLLNHQSDEGESVFLENQRGSFETEQVGLERNYSSARGAAAADYDSDGCLDVFVIQAGNWLDRRPAGYGDRADISSDNGNPNHLFDGDCGSFEETSDEAGIEGEAWSLATSFVDITDDGLPDVHVANDFNNDVVYANEGDGSFERRVLPDYTDRNGMSSEIGDVNGDGLPDIFVSNIFFENESHSSVLTSRYGDRIDGNNLLINSKGEGFTDEVEKYDVRQGNWGWAAIISDFDNDYEMEIYQAVSEGHPSVAHDDLYWNLHRSEYRRTVFDSDVNTYGAARLDFDLDGRQDIVASGLKENFRLYRNENEAGNWLQVELEGDTGGLGAEVVVTADGNSQTAWKHSNVDYLSQSSRTLHFGLGDSASADVQVNWTDGSTIETNVEANQRITLSSG